MLKIKNDVDLKELERFGFKDNDGIYKKMTEDGTGRDSDIQEFLVVVYEDNDRQIYHQEGQMRVSASEYEVQDLIKADLVEKVNDFKKEEI